MALTRLPQTSAEARRAARLLPSVSVIVPVYNDARRLTVCLDALQRQVYPSTQVEILVVDNGSTDDVAGAVGSRPQVRLLHEPAPGSYAARNRGLRQVTGDVVAFTDADCVPDPHWLARGVACLTADERIGLVAGRVELFCTEGRQLRAPELYELLHGFPQKRYAEERNFGATANVLTRRSVIEKVGGFNAALRSGGDNDWGCRVHSAGYRVQYCDEAIVHHPTRATWTEHFKKLARVIGGYTRKRMLDGYPWRNFLKDLLHSLVPPLGAIRRGLKDDRLQDIGQVSQYVFAVFVIRYASAVLRVRYRFGAAPPR